MVLLTPSQQKLVVYLLNKSTSNVKVTFIIVILVLFEVKRPKNKELSRPILKWMTDRRCQKKRYEQDWTGLRYFFTLCIKIATKTLDSCYSRHTYMIWKEMKLHTLRNSIIMYCFFYDVQIFFWIIVIVVIFVAFFHCRFRFKKARVGAF